ncbi:hypothetical protein ACS0TY_010320 [Phlomoides rotata]
MQVMRDKKYPQKSKLSSEIRDDDRHDTTTLSEPAKKLQIVDIPLNCSLQGKSPTCPSAKNYPSSQDDNQAAPPSCPDYFRWIHEDLWPWRETGITQEMVMSGRRTAHFRLVIVDGKAYVETYSRPYQTRDIFTQWGILQLLRRYPGKLPDLDLMFDCGDFPAIMKGSGNVSLPAPAPLFAYAANDSTHDIVFPDWSFWGWPEINTKAWEILLKELEEANKKSEWSERDVHAYWKGNPEVAWKRIELLKCNVSEEHDWNARIYVQNWFTETSTGFKHSDLPSQCMHRYKIYIEGCSWSVSLKYILACDSTTLLINPNFYDFFTRGLVPLKHYWPIKDHNKCRSIRHAVHWGNNHPQQAQAIGEAGADFILNQLKMDYVYDYMFHLLSAYAKLLTYKPTVPEKAVQICPESLACPTKGFMRKCMMDSRVKAPSLSQPCALPPPYDPVSLRSVIHTKDSRIKRVDNWEKRYWQAG